MQLDLIDAINAAPSSPYGGPGFKEHGGASEAAAKAVKPKAATIRKKVLRLLEAHPDGLTAPHVCRMLKGAATLNSVRSRLSELSDPCKKTGEVYAYKHGRRDDPDSEFAVAVYRSLLFKGEGCGG